MGKRKNTKTYFVFTTIEGDVGIAAGLGEASNEEVKEADSKELIANGFRQRGCVFTRLGDLDIDQARKMKEEGKLQVETGRYHVSYFLKNLPELEGGAASVARNLRESLEKSERRRAADEARRSALEASRNAMEMKHPNYRKFQGDFFSENLERYGFVECGIGWGLGGGLVTYEKNGVTVVYDGGEVSNVLVDGDSVEEMSHLNIPEARCMDDNLCYRLGEDNFPFWKLILERVGV